MTNCRGSPYNPSIRAPYNRNPSGTIHFNANASWVTNYITERRGRRRKRAVKLICDVFIAYRHAMPESPPDSASEPPYSPSETNRSGSSIGGSPCKCWLIELAHTWSNHDMKKMVFCHRRSWLIDDVTLNDGVRNTFFFYILLCLSPLFIHLPGSKWPSTPALL